MQKIRTNIQTTDGWDIIESSHDDTRHVTVGSNFLCGNGYLGYRGTIANMEASDFVACIVSDTYDMADGKWRELCNAPNGLFLSLHFDGQPLTLDDEENFSSKLDLQSGEVTQHTTWSTTDGNAKVTITTRKFSSYSDLHLLAQRSTIESHQPGKIQVLAGIDGRVWSLNGEHFIQQKSSRTNQYLIQRCTTGEHKIDLVVGSITEVDGDPGDPTEEEDRRLLNNWEKEVAEGTTFTVETMMGVSSSNDVGDPLETVTTTLSRANKAGYEAEHSASLANWNTFWQQSDVIITGDQIAQAALRFCIYHNRIATPAHADNLPIGARGLSCQAYQGAAFWDQEIFNLPAFVYTQPDVARNILTYRAKTLNGARQKAKKLGYEGAYFAWISGKSGVELCPDFFFKDVLTGRPIRNHFNNWQMHVSPDIVHAIWQYYLITEDWDFIVEYGAEIIFEVAQFLRSFVKYNEYKKRYECIRLLGPDEYHENVDNNAYSNYLVRAALNRAVTVHGKMQAENPREIVELKERLDLSHADLAAWARIQEAMYLPEPDPETGLIEQFDGFFQLEDITPDELAERLIDPGEYWGWPNGIAVHTQVSKQPDVIQLFALLDIFPREIQKANYEYYEPRCQHGSSLSHSMHALIATRVGNMEQAYEYFMRTALVDLTAESKAVVGGTFIGGIHTAACAGAYQAAVFGFGGLEIDKGEIVVDPHIPEHWESIEYRLNFRNNWLTIKASSDKITVSADKNNSSGVPICFAGQQAQLVEPGSTTTVNY